MFFIVHPKHPFLLLTFTTSYFLLAEYFQFSLSIAWSLKTCILLHRKSMKTQKIFFRMTSSLIAIMWALVSTLRRLLSIIGFFTPSLGLFNILYHWLAEQYLFTMRNKYHPLPVDQIQLFNMSQVIHWKEYDRATYEFPEDPAPPSYALYTGFTLKYYVAVFFMLQVFNTVSIAMVKKFTSEDFQQDNSIFKKILHCLQCLNIPYPYEDWDQGSFSIKVFKERFNRIETEMAGSFAVNMFFSVVSLLPIVYTGKIVCCPAL